MGYSIGRWEGDTFIVDTIGQNGKTWLDMRGLPATEALRVTERFTRPTIGRIFIDVTIDDPKAYTKPWDVRLSWDLQPDTDLIESICEENNRDLPHMVGKYGRVVRVGARPRLAGSHGGARRRGRVRCRGTSGAEAADGLGHGLRSYHVQGNVWVIAGAGGNITVQASDAQGGRPRRRRRRAARGYRRGRR